MHHAAGIVERFVVDRKARVPGGAEDLQRFGHARFHAQRDDVGARDHDVFDPDIVKLQDVAQQRALMRGEIAGGRLA